MNTDCTMSRIIAGALLTGGIAVAGLGLAAGAAQANPRAVDKHVMHWCATAQIKHLLQVATGGG